MEQKFVDTKKGKIYYYLDSSFKSRPFVVLLHGLSSNHTTWLKIMDDLHKNGYNVLALDMRGHGLSDKSKNKSWYDLSVFGDDLNQIIEKENIEDFILVGYSFGGQVALEYIAKYPAPVKGLMLVSVNHATPLKYKGLRFLTPIFYWTINLAAFLLLWQSRKKYHYYRHGAAVGYWDSVRDGFITMPLSVNFWMLANEFKINFKNTISRINVPTIIFCGEDDFFITKKEIREMAAKIPKSEIIFSKHHSHFVGTNAQHEMAEVIINFMKKYEGGDF